MAATQVFQCLLLRGENAGEGALRQAQGMVISDREFQAFLDRHSEVACLVPESNEAMKNSYAHWLSWHEHFRHLIP